MANAHSNVQRFDFHGRGLAQATQRGTEFCNAGFPTCCVADFQIGSATIVVRSAGLETRDTADLEIGATKTTLRLHVNAACQDLSPPIS
jgi:hypothetical protein